MICLSFFEVRITKDDSSLSIVLKSCFIAVIGLNFVAAVGAGKNARSARSKSLLTKLFVAGGSEVLRGVVRAWLLAREGAVASGGAMVERGDRSSIHVGSHRKAYRVENDFLFFVVPEL